MENKKKSTIKDIAAVLGLTPSAVSKALNNHPRISEKTKIAVKEAAIQLDYQPNYLSSALRKGKSNLVGVIIPRVNSHFFSSVVENIEKVLNLNGYNIIMTQSNELYVKECQEIDTLLKIQVDGIIASMANETTNLEYYQKIKSKTELVLFDRGEEELNVDYVGIDDYKSSHLVVDHLVSQNCNRIAHIAGFKHIRIYKERIRGYKDALEKWNLESKENWIIESNLRLEDGRRIMQQLLDSSERPDAVYVAGDIAALGALQVLLENNIKVPEEIALIGFSDEPFTSLTQPSISTVNQHSDQIGKLTAEAFLERMKNPKKKTINRIILEPELIIRQSSNRDLK
ncbi:transcriptional regulator, LacI family [Flavobacterium glycines]|uniref:LacI family transcriptional regulator n=1 Tax=Flavobacterium glycines TaxID=551990 RepID=A0A1B9DZ82_9FLAO|nr:LacI family DNA-binding transcriptional regulator [Flavobacterium glycines]OCB74999.1 LacI family transcriptional regulator [Flavobacterium glycines]GEL11290.1 LacI family transcriptional regulator [Flavobacterium glycines]SDJ43173.1 transcriptional regulator, LacI family [Flavobacterium glycines]